MSLVWLIVLYFISGEIQVDADGKKWLQGMFPSLITKDEKYS